MLAASRWASRLCAVVLGVLGGPALGASEEPDRVAELSAIRGRIGSLRQQLSTVEARETSLRRSLIEAEVRVLLQRESLEEAQVARKIAGDAAAAAEEAAQQLTTRLARIEASLADSRWKLYRASRRGWARWLAELRRPEVFVRGVRFLRFFARRDGALAAAHRQAEADLAAERETRRVRLAETEEWRSREARRLEALEEVKEEHAGLLRRVEAQLAQLLREANRLETHQGKLARFLDALQGRARLEGEAMGDFRGVLDRPVVGSLVRKFGPRRDPRYQTLVPHNGWQFVTLDGAPVRAVYPGEVLYSAEFEGYGLTVIVRHPGRFFSLYASLRRLRVRRGDMVGLNQVVGESPGSVYFEVRAGNRPVDPQPWFR